MEKVDVVDIYTPTGGDKMDILPPYVGDGHSRQLALLTYTEKVRGSSPFAPTKMPSPMGVLALIKPYMGVLDCVVRFWGKICCNPSQSSLNYLFNHTIQIAGGQMGTQMKPF
jgi:hypothetical protein